MCDKRKMEKKKWCIKRVCISDRSSYENENLIYGPFKIKFGNRNGETEGSLLIEKGNR